MSDRAAGPDDKRLPRVFLGLTEVSGFYKGLKSGLDQLGVNCTFVSLGHDPREYGGDYTNLLIRMVKYCAKKRYVTARSRRVVRFVWGVLRMLLQPFVFLWALWKFDVFIFGFNTSFLFYYDLPILKLLGKRIIYQFHGSDSRPPYLGSLVKWGKQMTAAECIRLTARQKKVIRTIERYADVIVNNPTGAHFHERPFVVWLHIGLPCQLPAVPAPPEPVAKPPRHFRILHSPSHPEAKGSPTIRRVVDGLKAKGYDIELVEIAGQPNSVVLEELSRCEFVIDQLYSDYPMPGFATEAAWFGKPVIIGGYAADLWEKLLPAHSHPPTLYCHPDDLEDVVVRMIEDKALRDRLAGEAARFVRSQWHPKKVAERYLRLIEGDIPQEWLYDPRDIRYVHGGCLPEWRVKELVRQVIEQGGVEALQLSDKPALERHLVEFSRGDESGAHHR